jgi:predicted metal-dependent hydrolase
MAPQEFWQGIEEFNQQKFYNCHDTLEALWMEAGEPQKKFYQGILQIAVSCYHLSNRNWRGAVILLGEGTRKLTEYQPAYEEINVSQLVEQSSQLLKTLQQLEPERIEEFVQQIEWDPVDRNQDGNFKYKLPKISKIDNFSNK